jgi:DNA-binding XRE family transcriptional regulator
MLYITDIKCYNVGYMSHNEPKSSRTSAKRPLPPPVRRALREVFGDVSSWRKLRGLTQAQLANRAGVSRDTVLRLENGDGGVSIETLFRVLRALGLLDNVTRALDPYESEIGRIRSVDQLPKRVRPKDLRNFDEQ